MRFSSFRALAAGLAVFIGQAFVFPLTVGKLILLVHDRGVEDIQFFLRRLDALLWSVRSSTFQHFSALFPVRHLFWRTAFEESSAMPCTMFLT